MTLGIVIGNTRVRYGRLDAVDVHGAGDFPWAELARSRFRPLVRLLRDSRPERVVAASVRDDRLADVRNVLRHERPSLEVMGADIPVPIENRYERPEEVGVDRLLACVAARDMWPRASVVVLDFGTALSVSVVGADGAFLGGLIGIGARAASDAVQSATPALPPIVPRLHEGLLRRSTREALSAGLFWQLAGGAQRILDGLRSELSPPVRAVATGGDAELLAAAVEGIDRVEPHLVLMGLGLAVRAAGSSGAPDDTT